MKLFFSFLLLAYANITFGQIHFLQQPHLVAATTSSLDIAWLTNANSEKATIWWGRKADHLDHFTQVNTRNKRLDNLLPATVYYASIQYQQDGMTYQSDTKPFITSSLSTGEMRVYFNFSVDDSFSNGSVPTTTATDIEAKIINRILSANNTIDICMYNVNRPGYISALKQAAANGVQVRYITDANQSNYSLKNTTLNFPVLYGDGSGIMHNKFLIIDKDSTEAALVLTGAYNFTNSNLYDGYNNMISIQDQSLAEIYTMEFEEMWGSTDAQPNPTTSKLGDKKTDNTPHTVFVNDTKIESYFSPSDHTTSYIVNAINTADQDFRFSLLVFTNDDIENAILNLGVPVKGLIEEQYTGTATLQFQANGQSVYDFEENDHFLHHKYGIIDVEEADSDPTLITGSHNWSYSAEKYNDENTLIIHNADIANIYLQEFEERWKTIVAIDEINGIAKIQAFPNPASTSIVLQNNLSFTQTVSIVDCLGRQMKELVLRPNQSRSVDIQYFPQGIYYLLLQAASGTISSEKLVIYHE